MNRVIDIALRIRTLLEGAESVEDLQQGMDELAAELEQTGQDAQNAGQKFGELDEAERKAGKGAKEAAGPMEELKVVLAGIVTLSAAKEILDLNDRLTGLRRGFETVIGSSQGADQALEFVNKTADRLGTNTLDLAQAFLKVTASAKGTQLEGAPTEKIFSSIAGAMSTVNASGEELERVMDAVGQMMGKGVVSAEELRGQLGDSLPGAVQQAAQALLVSNAELSKMLESGEVIASEFLPKFAAQLEKSMGGGGKQVEGFSASWNRLVNQLVEIATGPAGQGFTAFVAKLTDTLTVLTRGVGFATDNISALGRLLGGLAAGEGSAAFKDFGQSVEDASIHLLGMKTAAEQATENQRQMAAEVAALTTEIDAFQDAVARDDIKALPESLQAAIADLKKTGDVAAATEEAISSFITAPAKNIDLSGVLRLATSIQAVSKDAKDAGDKITATLGESLAKLTNEQLTALEAQAKKAMAAAGDDQNARRVFADLGQIIEGVVLARLERLGVDGREALTGISANAKEAMNDFTSLANNAQLSADTLEKAFEAALDSLDSPEELEAFKQRIIELGNDGKLTAEQMQRAFLLIRQRLQEAAQDPAFDALLEQLEKVHDETELEIATLERQQSVSATTAKAAIDLAKAKGDEAKAIQLTAEAAQQEVSFAQERITQLQRQNEEIKRHIQQLYEQANADGRFSDEELEVIERLKEKSGAIDADIAKIKAHLPLQQQEADAAARAAGPLGQLVRSYELKTAATKRDTDAVERGYDAKIRDLHVEQDQAKAKGDTAKVAELAIKIKEEEAKKAQALADAKKVELQAEIDLIEAKKAAIPLDEQQTEAGQEKIAAMDAQIAKLRDLIDAEQDKAKSAQALVDAEKKSADVFDNASKNAYKFSNAQADVDKRNKEVGSSLKMVMGSTESLGIAMAKFRGETAIAFAGPGMSRYNTLINDIKSSIDNATRAAQNLAENGLGAGVDQAESLINELEASDSSLNEMAHGAAQALRQALADARREAEDMTRSLAEAAESFEREILRIKGNQRALLDREYQDELRRLEEMHQKTGQQGDAEYQQAKSRAEELHKLKMQQLADEEAAKRKQESSGGNSSTSPSGGSGGGGAPSGGGTTQHITNNFYTDPTQLASEEWYRRTVIPMQNKLNRLQK